MKCEFKMSQVFLAHHQGASSVSIPISCAGADLRLKGTAVQILDLSSPCVTLLTDYSTPDHRVEDNAAAGLFAQAAEKAFREGSSFYTVLRPSWALPAVCWKKV